MRARKGQDATTTPQPPADAPKDCNRPNGQDKTPILHHEIIGKVRAGWTVFAILMSGFWTLAAILVANGWIAAPAKSVDLEMFKREINIQLDGIKRDGAEAKIIMKEMQRSQVDLLVRLAGIAATLTDHTVTKLPPAR